MMEYIIKNYLNFTSCIFIILIFIFIVYGIKFYNYRKLELEHKIYDDMEEIDGYYLFEKVPSPIINDSKLCEYYF